MGCALIIALLAASAHIAAAGGGAGYAAPPTAAATQAVAHREESLGPVIRTGRYRVIQERIVGGGGESDGYQQGPGAVQAREPTTMHMDRPFLRARPEDLPENAQRRFHYDGPNDGRRVWIYRRVQTPVRVVNGVVERLGPGQTVERWAEGGYKGAQSHNLDVYHRDGQEVFADRVIPVKSVFGEEIPL